MTSTIYIYGAPGVGKSTIGKILAKNLNIPFVDLDAEIEKEAEISIPQIFEREGEESFRDREERALKSVRETSVVALGGGALLREVSRNHVSNKQVICLQASLVTLTERLQLGTDNRPLLKNNSLKKLLDTRKEHYASFNIQIDTENRSPKESAVEIQNRLGRFYLRGTGEGYAARVENGGLEKLGDLLEEYGCQPPFMLISDSNLALLYAEKVAQSVGARKIAFAAGEKNKTITTMTQLWRDLLREGMERGGTIIALGGGITNDMAGFAAATIMRGAAWVSLPTSLLAMVDASLGGKTGANLPEGKNLVGAFYPPKFVLADPETLHTLPDAEIRNGLAEVVKHGVIDDPELFSLCKSLTTEHTENTEKSFKSLKNSVDSVLSVVNLSKIIKRAMAVKIRIIEEDPFEQGIRAALNFGHTIGHGIENLMDYGIRHGEAVGIGMVAEARLAEQMGIAEFGLADEIAETLVFLGLPVDIPNGISAPALVAAMQTDKKKSKGMVKFSLPVRVGEIRVGVVIEGLEEILQRRNL